MIVCLNSIRSQVIFLFFYNNLHFLIVHFILTVNPLKETNENDTGSIFCLRNNGIEIFSIISYTWCLTNENAFPTPTHIHIPLREVRSFFFFFRFISVSCACVWGECCSATAVMLLSMCLIQEEDCKGICYVQYTVYTLFLCIVRRAHSTHHTGTTWPSRVLPQV